MSRKLLLIIFVFIQGIGALLCLHASGQKATDSLTRLIDGEKNLSKKAAWYLQRAVTYGKRDSARAFLDVKKASEYYARNNDLKGLADAYLARANVYSLTAIYKKAFSYDSLALALADSISYPKGKAAALSNLGREQFRLGYLKDAEKSLNAAVLLVESFNKPDKNLLARLYNRLGVVNAEMGNYADCLAFGEKAVALAESLHDNSLLLRVYANHANAFDRIAKYERSTQIHIKAIRLAERLGDTTALIREYNNLAITFRHLREPDKAISYYRKSLALASARRDRQDYRSMGLSMVNMATVYVQQDKMEKLDTLYNQALDYFTKANDLYGQALAYHNYGNYLIEDKRYALAEENLLKALVLRKKSGVQPAIASTLAVLGKTMLKQNRISDAEKYLFEAKEILEGDENGHSVLSDLYTYLIRLNARKKNYKTAFEYQEKKLALGEVLFNESEKVNSMKAQTEYELEKRDLMLSMEKENYRNRQRFIIIIGGALLLVLGLLLVILVLRRRQGKERHRAALLRLQQEHRLDLADSLKKTEQEERRKIAHKLHDEAGALLSIAKLNVAQLQKDVFVAGSDAEQKLRTTQKLLADVSESVRNISHTLMPVALEKYGLKAALQDLISAINTSGTIRAEEVLHGMDDTRNWDTELCLTVYRTVQEVLNNVIRHAEATHVLVQVMELENTVSVYIEDDGKGLDNEGAPAEGIGLTLLKRNIEYLNGTVEVNGKKNQGTFVLAELPVMK